MSTLFDNILFNAVAWAKEAGAMQLEYFSSNNLAIETKLNQSDIVTAAMPDEHATAPTPFSSVFIRFSKAATVGLLILV